MEVPTRIARWTLLSLTLCTGPLLAQTADDLVARCIKALGGAEKINSITTLRRTGTYTGGGGSEAPIVILSKRPAMYRRELTTQGLTGITAYDGKTGWKIQPWEGKKDPEPMDEELLKSVREEADFDGPLVNSRQKGITIEYVGMEAVEGSDAYKLKVNLPDGDTRYYFLDADEYVPILIEDHLIVRGEERVYETSLSDYKEVSGWYVPFSTESNVKGSPEKWIDSYESIRANELIDDSLFAEPAGPAHSH